MTIVPSGVSAALGAPAQKPGPAPGAGTTTTAPAVPGIGKSLSLAAVACKSYARGRHLEDALAREDALEPARPLEDREEGDARQEHQAQRERVAEGPVQLGDVPEVHAVDRPDQRGCEEDR